MSMNMHARRSGSWGGGGVLALIVAIILVVVLYNPIGGFLWKTFHIHLPGTTVTTTDIGPWVLQKIEGIDKPALGQANFTFAFEHKVSENIGPWPCWYSMNFYAVGHASATVNLNPGPAWWQPSTGHYRLQVLSSPVGNKPGAVAVAIVLPNPQLPQTVHDVTIDDTASHPLGTDHSWTYPGFGCGALLRPQFSLSVMYVLAQQKAFDMATHSPAFERPIIAAAEAEATTIIRDNFVQPTVNALKYNLTSFTLSWAKGP